MAKHIICIAFVFSLVGCPIAQYPRTSGPTAINVQGTYFHSNSGMNFPENVGPFRRGTVSLFDSTGANIGVGYNLGDLVFQVAVTVYVYPAPSVVSILSPAEVTARAKELSAQQHFETVKSDIIRAHPEARLVSEEEVTLVQAGGIQKGKKAGFEFEGVFANQRQQLKSHAYLFVHGKWFIKYRITYPQDIDGAVREKIKDFMNSLQWPMK